AIFSARVIFASRSSTRFSTDCVASRYNGGLVFASVAGGLVTATTSVGGASFVAATALDCAGGFAWMIWVRPGRGSAPAAMRRKRNGVRNRVAFMVNGISR